MREEALTTISQTAPAGDSAFTFFLDAATAVASESVVLDMSTDKSRSCELTL